MAEAARDDDGDDLTPEERAQLRALLRLLRKAGAEPVDVPTTTAVGRKAPRKATPRPEIMAAVIERRRRRGHGA